MTHQIVAELVGSVLAVPVALGDSVAEGDTIVLIESMKMEIPVLTEQAGTVREIKVAQGDVVQEGDVMAVVD